MTFISLDAVDGAPARTRYRRFALWQSLATDNRYVVEMDEMGQITGVSSWENREMPTDPRTLEFSRKRSLLEYIGNKPGLQMILQTPTP